MANAEKSDDVIKVPGALKGDLLVAYFRARAARGEFSAVSERAQRLIAKLDKDGELAKAINETGVLHAQVVDAQTRLNAIIAKVQGEVRRDLTGFVISPEGDLVRMAAKRAGTDAARPAEADKR